MSRSIEPLNTTGSHVATRPLKSVHKQIFRALLILSSAALVVRVFGMLNQIVASGRFGAGAKMDAYFVASTLPLLTAQLASSAVESSVIPVYVRVRTQGKERASILFSTSLNLLLISAALLTGVMLVFRYQIIHLSAPALDPFRTGFAVSLTPFIFPVVLLMIVITFLESILNAEGQFGWPAYAGLLVPLTTTVFILTAGSSYGILVLCIGMLVGLCLQLCMVIVRAWRARLVYRPILDLRNPDIGAILVAMSPSLFSILISQASPLIDQIFASSLAAGSISALNYSLKLVGVFSGVIFVSTGRAALPYLSHQASINDMKAFKETLRLYLWILGIGTTLLAALTLVLAHPLVQIIFQRGAFTAADTNRTASALIGFLIGLTPMALGFNLARAFIALRKKQLLLYTTVFSVIANAIFDYIFAHFWQSTGIALSTSAVYFGTMFILLFMLRRTIGKLELFKPPPEILAVIRELGRSSYLRPVTWKEELLSLFSFLRSLRQHIIRVGIMLVVFAVGVVGVLQNSLYTLRAAFGSIIVLAFLRYPYVLLIAWVTIGVFIGSRLPLFNGNNLDTGLIVPTLLLAVTRPIKPTFKRMPALAYLLVYLLWVLASIGISPLSVGAFLTSWTIFLSYVAIGVLTINVITTRQRLIRLIDAILLVSAFVSLYGIYGYITKQNGILDTTASLFRISSIFDVAPTLALFLSVVVPLAFYRTLLLRGFKRVGGLLLLFVILVALGLTFSRGAYISVPLGIIIMTFCLPSRGMKFGLLRGIVVLAVLIVLLQTVGNVPILDRFFSQDISTLNGRTYIWQVLFNHFDPTSLLGNGLQASDALLVQLQSPIYGHGVIGTAAHELFLGTLYDQGIIGLILLICVFISLAVSLIGKMRKARGDHRMVFAMALAAFVSVLVQSLESNDFWVQAVGIYAWIVMALPFALCWTAPQQPSDVSEEVLGEVAEPRISAIPQTEHEQISKV